jgi:hypothetical protein
MEDELARLMRPVHNGELGPNIVARYDPKHNILYYNPALLHRLHPAERQEVLRTTRAVTMAYPHESMEDALTLH